MMRIFFFFWIVFALFSCSADDLENQSLLNSGAPTEPRGPFDRTVLVYISGENNLSSYIKQELKELRQGSIGIGNNALVIYVDDSNSKRNPYVIWVKDGKTIDSLALTNDPLSSGTETMKMVLNHVSTYYPAEEYGLALWGHASGWLMEDSIATKSPNTHIARRAYGLDNGENSNSQTGKWMNMSTLAKTLWEWKHLKFIFADCCQFQCIESAYELRNVTDYIIGSPAEVPGSGAPYETVTKGLFDHSERFYEKIVDSYFEQTIPFTYSEKGGWNSFTIQSRVPLSVIKTSELRNLADATNTVLHAFIETKDEPEYAGQSLAWPDLRNKRLIYYRGNRNKTDEDLMYDMNDFIRKFTLETTKDTAAYETWKKTFDRTVIYKKNAKNGWMTLAQIQPYVFSPNVLTDSRYGGVSMFVPQDRKNTWYYPYSYNSINYGGYNADIKKTAWYADAHLSDFGGDYKM